MGPSAATCLTRQAFARIIKELKAKAVNQPELTIVTYTTMCELDIKASPVTLRSLTTQTGTQR
jgi:hypothetical protein